MGVIQAQRRCGYCKDLTLHSRKTFGLAWGLFLSIITLGFFIPVWVLIKIHEAMFQKWICQRCGRGRRT